MPARGLRVVATLTRHGVVMFLLLRSSMNLEETVSCPVHGELILERPSAQPNAVVEVRETLPDGTEIKAVWSLLRQSGVAKLVTVHFFDGHMS